MSSKRFDIILVGYRAADTAKALRFCSTAFDESMVRRKVLVLNNPAMTDRANVPNDWEVIEGSNQFSEFSGWQEGLRHVQPLEGSSAGVVFINDSVVTHRHFTKAQKMALVGSLRQLPRGTLLGFKDHIEGDLSLGSLPLDGWVSTYCFVLDLEALHQLDYKLYESNVVDEYVRGGVEEQGFFRHLSPDLEAHLRHWLFGGGWYAAARLNEKNASKLYRKAKCIIAEKLLSARCQARSITVVDPFDNAPLLRTLSRIERRLSLSLSTH